jgi:hypothetical protein
MGGRTLDDRAVEFFGVRKLALSMAFARVREKV